MIGATVAARRAGMKLATNATTPNATPSSANVSGSVALTPKSRLAITRVKPNAATRPMAIPAPTTITAWPITSRRMSILPCTEGRADAELARPLRHPERDHAVDADRREQRRAGGEHAQQEHREPATRERVVQSLLHRVHVVHRQVGVERSHLTRHRRRESRRIRRCADHEEPAWNAKLVRRVERGDRRFAVHLVLLRVRDDAHDRAPRSRVAATETLADRVLTGPEPRRELVVDDGDVGRAADVAVVEEPTLEQRDAHRSEIVGVHVPAAGDDQILTGRFRDVPFDADRLPA